MLLGLNEEVGAAVGIDFGHSHLRAAVADLSSTILAERSLEIDVDHDAHFAIEAAASLVDRVLREAGVGRGTVIGAGIGLPGPIDQSTGAVGSSIILPGWAGMRAGEALSRRLQLPVQVDNDANLGARAEHSFGAGRGADDMVYVQLRAGIGAGIVVGGRLHRGTIGLAGELGHVQVNPDGALCRCGNRGCLETVASAPALVALLRPTFGETTTVRDMLELVAAGDVGASRIVNDAGRAVGRVLADLCNHLNPARIVVGGELSAAGTPLLEGIRESIDRHALPSAAATVDVRRGELGERAELLGALTLVIGDIDSLRSADLPALRRLRGRNPEAVRTVGGDGSQETRATEGGDSPTTLQTALATRE